MSHVLIQQYLNNLQDLRKVSGTGRESVVREAFKDLLKGWARSHDLVFVPEYEITTPAKDRRYVDGALLHALRMPFGYWEAKDEKDDLDTEIENKLRRGYPQDNIIFEDSRQAVLIQNKAEVMRCPVDNVDDLQRLLALFFGYQRPEITEFRKAVEQFKTDLPAVLDALRDMIEHAYTGNPGFRSAADAFLKQAQETVNPGVTEADVREILIQHILTEEIFALVFPGTNYHEDNNIARELYRLEQTFFTGNTKHQTLKALEPYYASIRRAASQIARHHEKQTFLKVVYENFYKVYNPKAADRLGVVYTPNEIVRFMIESADWLCERHFGRNLIDKNVEILDPAAGTGTFICELLEHFRGQPKKLKHKYLEELHANEVAILPYYVANLNIEATYAAISDEYLEYQNLCFVDTLDNIAGLRKYAGHMDDLFGSVSEENIARIKRQNSRKISVIIGNPPYNANQANENDNNKNREYPNIDKRIADTYMALRDSHKSKTYDMYTRFFRWASDRIADEGVVAFVTNRSFIDKRAFDGFRKSIAREFTNAYIVDLGGDVRDSDPSTKANVFGIRVGVAISFFVRTRAQGFAAKYVKADHGGTEDKIRFLSSTPISRMKFEQLQPDKNGDWSKLERAEFGSLLPLALPKLSGKKATRDKRSIFEVVSFGTVSNRDDWVWDHDATTLAKKINFYIDTYSTTVANLPSVLPKDWETLLDYDIKWTQDLRRRATQRTPLQFDESCIVRAQYRPYVREFQYYSNDLNWSLYRMPLSYPSGEDGNESIYFSDRGARSPFSVLGTDRSAELHLCASTDGFQSVSMFRYENGTRVDNITDWALAQFREHYGKAPPSQPPPSGGRSQSQAEAVDSLPQRGRVGVGETPQRLFVPKPLPASLKAFARTLRGNATHAERLVWEMLRREQTGVKFRRQHPLEPYVLDFYCMARKFAIEIDGGQHNDAAGRAHDEKRTAFLASRGIRVLRFWNNDVMQNPEGVWETILTALEEPPPQPSPAGGGSDMATAGGGSKSALITKEAVFHYVYAVLHDPIYREKYAQNLKREFPRIPFYPDFWRWAGWGEELMDLHTGYEAVEPYPLERTDLPMDDGMPVRKGRSRALLAEDGPAANAKANAPKALLKADKDNGRILLDTQTTLAGVPPEAWDYKLGNRSALEWILDQYKEKKPKDPTIREKFNTYRFADYKEKVIDLLMRVATVSIRTVAITDAMKQAKR